MCEKITTTDKPGVLPGVTLQVFVSCFLLKVRTLGSSLSPPMSMFTKFCSFFWNFVLIYVVFVCLFVFSILIATFLVPVTTITLISPAMSLLSHPYSSQSALLWKQITLPSLPLPVTYSTKRSEYQDWLHPVRISVPAVLGQALKWGGTGVGAGVGETLPYIQIVTKWGHGMESGR